MRKMKLDETQYANKITIGERSMCVLWGKYYCGVVLDLTKNSIIYW